MGESNQETRISFSEGTNMAAQVSPDQSTVVFDLLGRLWIMPVEGGAPAAITDPYGNARLPKWSPDGQKILFQGYWTGTWQIYTINPDGSGLEQITEGPYDHREPSWGPDATAIYYAADITGNYDIWSLDLLSGAAQNITQQAFNQFAPIWHPGRGLTYLSDDPDASGIIRLADDQRELIYASEEEMTGLSWNTDASLLSFQEAGEIQFLSFEPAELPKKTTWKQPEEDLFPFALSWLDEGRFIYTADGQIKKGSVASKETNTIPFNIELRFNRPTYTSKPGSISVQNASFPVKGIFMPRLSPEGHRAVMILMQDIWLRESSGEMRQITDDPYVEMAPVWSPDGKEVAYLSDRSGSFSIYIRNLDTNEDRFLTKVGGSIAGLAWSPDGQRLAYSASYGPRQGRVFVCNISDGNLQMVGGLINSSVGAPSWSPDSRTIALSTLKPYSTRFREGVNTVLFIDTKTGERQILGGLPHFSVGTRAYNGPEWSPDGKYLATISSSRLWLIPITPDKKLAGDPILLTERLADAPSWSADGKELLFIGTDRLVRMNVESQLVLTWPLKMEVYPSIISSRKLIRAGYLFDGIQKTWLQNQDILVDGNRIVDIRPASAENEQGIDTVVDASDQYVMPGLIEGHAHQGSWDGELLGRTMLAWGITASRDPASDPYDALNRREAQIKGKAWSPRIFFTGSPFDGSRIYYGGANALQDSAQIDLELDRADRLDYDLIKTYVRLSDPLQQKIIREAHEIGIPVSSHELYPAVTYGMDGLEHILGTSRRGYSPKMTAQNIAYDDVVNLIAQSGMSFCPTTGIYVSYNYLLAKDTSLLEDPKVKALMPEFNQFSARQGIAQVRSAPEAWEKDFTNAMRMVREVYEKGGWIVAGTDSPIIPFGFALHLELQAYAEAGIPNFDVLQTATINAARVLRREADLGSIEKGKLADILFLNADPTQDMKNLMQVDRVMINGELVSVAELMTGY
jgi:Tol biopolymer transport system component/imidazolonepropionase-like amidohydrolase